MQQSQVTAAALGRVAVLYGGTSSEREISLKSGAAVFAALQRSGCDVELVDVGSGFLAQLANARWDRVFIALHGVGGEDGVMQAALQMAGIPYTGSRVLASALAMDKWRTKLLWQAQGLPTPAYALLDAQTDWSACIAHLGGTAIVKPACEGSSIGMSRATCADTLRAAYEQASQFAGSVLAETWITGAEYTVAILDGEALPPIRLETTREFYNFEAKYQANDTRYLCPCGLDEAAERQLRTLALQAFDAVGCRGWGRVDVMADQQGNFFLLEVNTVPGMTDHSLVPMAARAAGLDFDALVLRVLAGAA